MPSRQRSSISPWRERIEIRREPLSEDLRTDVCVVGAGIAGLTIAYLLGREGRSVVVLDDGTVGSGETGRTTAHLSNAIDDRYFEIERLHGETGARLAAASHTAAVDRIEAIVAMAEIDCEFERLDGYLFTPPGESTDMLDRELAAVHRAGLTEVEVVARAPLAEFDTGRCLRFPRQAQFHPMKYLAGLVGAIEQQGGVIFTGTHANAFDDGDAPHVGTATGQTVTADSIVVATNTPVNNRVTIHTKQAAYRSYVIAARVAKDAVRKALYWDTADPYHYVRLHSAKGRELVIAGGEDHKTGQDEDEHDRFRSLESWTRTRFPIGDVEFRWSGQVMEPVDSLAFIGRNPGDRNTYIVTGDSGNGMTHGTIAGILITDLIMGRSNPWATLYDPGRVTLKATATYASENLNVAGQYADLVTTGEVAAAADIAPGEGAVIRRGLKKIAVSKDMRGQLHECSAVCTHLGCVVAWNSTEKTWDCPCHGSRFAPDGAVLNGPAVSPLESVESAVDAVVGG